MLGIDIAILVGIAFVAVAGAALVGGSFNRRLEQRRRRALGAKNASEERRRLDEVCVVCQEPVDAHEDLWEGGEWWHRHCWREHVE